MVEETEVFRLSSNSAPPNNFNKTKCYAFALYTRTDGSWPNQRYYTTNTLQYLGKHVRSEEWGFGEGHGGAEIFDDNGKETRIVYDYQGRTCFKIVPRKIDGGSKINGGSKIDGGSKIKRTSRKMKQKVKKSRRNNI
jgi:hypothetical protein